MSCKRNKEVNSKGTETRGQWSRRQALVQFSAGAAALTPILNGCTFEVDRRNHRSNSKNNRQSSFSLAEEAKKRKFLIVITATGGASIIDSFMAFGHSESSNFANINCFPDGANGQLKRFEGTNLRAVDISLPSFTLPVPVNTSQSSFVQKHMKDIMVATLTGTSVNHNIAQKRGLTGNEAWNGRTLQEAVAAQYGKGLPIPNVNMGSMGFSERGIDQTLPGFAFHEVVANPSFWPFGLHGSKGIKGVPGMDLIQIARKIRDVQVEGSSNFFRTFSQSPRLQRWLNQRNLQKGIEDLDLINKLNAFPNSPEMPFQDYGLQPNPDAQKIRDVFPNYQTDPAEAEAMLAYLLITQGVSCSVTIGNGFDLVVDGEIGGDEPVELSNTPLGFDFSHADHRATQALVWDKTLKTIDKLITLLDSTEYMDGESYWQHSLIYIATDFGRDKTRANAQETFSTGHNLNNGVAIISPLANGGKALGGVDTATGNTYGFDPENPAGVPTAPGQDMSEKQIFSGILHALEVDTSEANLPNMRAMRKKA